MDPRERITELIDQAEELEYGPAKVALLDEAVREADASGDVDAGFYARLELITAATFSGAKEKAMVAFSWCLGQVDANPEQFDEEDLMWQYKWVVEELVSFPQISRRQIEEMLADMQRRYARLGISLRPVHYLRWTNSMRMGDLDLAMTEAEKWYAAPRDHFADCTACERNKHAELAIRLGKNEEAMELTRSILAGKLKCESIPHATYALVLKPLLRLGRIDEARVYHEKGYRMVAKDRGYLEEIAAHLFFMVRTHQWTRAVELLETHLPLYLQTANVDAVCRFYVAAASLLGILAQDDNAPRHFRIPQELPCYQLDDLYAPADLANWFDRQAAELIGRFNARNGNDYYGRQLDEYRQLALGT